MLVSQNSNKISSSLDPNRDHSGHNILLKPTGVPVFKPVDITKASIAENQDRSTDDSGLGLDNTQTTNPFLRTVRTQSLVIGKKVQNQTGINLIDPDIQAVSSDKQFPVKVIYQKPSFAKKDYLHHDGGLQGDQETDDNKENKKGRMNLEGKIKLKKEFPKTNAISDQQKLQEQKHRPKSAQIQLNKNQVQRSKLGANSDIKPQISYVQKVVKSQQRPQSAANQQTKQLNQEKRINAAKIEIEKSPKKETDIPFAQNRFQGQSGGNLTKELVKKAQESLIAQKIQDQKLKDEVLLKKLMQKQLAEEFKKKNQEVVQKQKEKGGERVDLRKKEEELKEKKRNEENNQDRKKARELREKRNQERNKQLGLDMFKEDKVEEYRSKVKQEIEQKEITQQKIKIVTRPQSQSNQPGQPHGAQVFQIQHLRPQSVFNNKNIKEMIKEQQELDKEEEEHKTRDKKLILKEMQQKKKHQINEQKRKEQEQEQKKLENMKNLEEELRLRKEEYMKKKEMLDRIKEEQKKIEDSEQEKQEQENKKQKKKKKKKQPKEQLNDLRNWIDLQLQQEEQNDQEDQENDNQKENSNDVKVKNRSRSRSKPQIQNKIVVQVNDKQSKPKDEIKNEIKDEILDIKNLNDQKLLKNQLPGNHLLAEKEESKLGVRSNRYGLYGDNGYGQVVEIQINKMDQQSKNVKQLQQQKKTLDNKPNQIQLTKSEKKKVQEHLKSKLKEVGHQNNLDMVEVNQEEDINDEDLYDYAEEEYDMKPVKEQKQNELKEIKRKVINEVIDKKQLKQPANKNAKLNKDITQASKFEVPGVLNVQAELKRQELEKLQKEKQATVVIQKWTRGFLARNQIIIQREHKRREIEEEYGHFEEQVKFNTDYNLQKFLKEKQRLREINKTTKIVESSDIQEIIGGESNSFGGRIAIQQVGASTSGPNTLLQNFFKERPDKDPLSLISIYAKAHMPQQHSARKKDSRQGGLKVQQHQSTHSQQRGHRHAGGHIMSSSSIQEEIYSEKFDDNSYSDNIGDEDDIDEDIIVSKESQESRHHHHHHHHGKPFLYKPQSIQESLPDEYLMSGDKRSRRTPGGDSSIAEESHLMSASKASQSSKKKGSIIGESIEEEYKEDGFESYSHSQSKKNGLPSKKDIQEFQNKMKHDENKRKEVVSEFLHELQRYEAAHISTTMVERMEKIISKSLAQKDKLIFAQRLCELENDKKHKDEINKIREEQIKLMSQLMLLGGSQYSGGPNSMTQKDREALMESITRIVEKPIIIQQQKQSSEGESDNIYEEQEDVDYIAESRTLKDIEKGKKKKNGHAANNDSIEESIVEEIPSGEQDDSYKSAEDDIKESVYVDGKKQVENILSKARINLGSEEAVRQQAKKTLDTNNKNPTVKSKQDQAGVFEHHAFEDFRQQQFQKLFTNNGEDVGNYLQQVEKVIDDKSKDDHKKLETDFKKQLISPRTFNKKQKEIEKWVSSTKSELHENKHKVQQTQEELGQFLNKLSQGKRDMLEKIGSPRHNKRLLESQNSSQASQLDIDDLDESSHESLRIREARRQLDKVSKPKEHEKESRELQKKKALTNKLQEEKEKTIQEGLKKKMKSIESKYVDEHLNEVLNIDVEREVERRYREQLRRIEESQNTLSLDNNGNAYDSARSNEENKKKKNVKFASPVGTSGRYSSMQSSESAQSKRLSSHKLEESIGESISIQESYSQSHNNIPSSFADSQNKQGQSQKSKSGDMKSSIRDSVHEEKQESESIIEDSYPEDFVSQSQISDKQSKQNQLVQSRNKLQQKAGSIDTENQQDIGYSMNFDEESMGTSQNFLPLPANKMSETGKKDMRVVEEEESQDSDHQASQNQITQSNNDYIKESFNYLQQEDDIQNSIQSSQPAVVSQQKDDITHSSLEDSQDKEVVQSSRSIEWLINIEQQKELESQRLKQSSVEQSDKYSENFDDELAQSSRNKERQNSIEEDEQEQSNTNQDQNDLDELESFPEELAQSFDNFQLQADNITDELLELILMDLKQDQEFKTQPGKVDEDGFKDKWPYTLEEDQAPPKPEVEDHIPTIQGINEVPKIEITKRAPSSEDFMKKKYELEQMQIREGQKKVEDYLNYLISQVDKHDLIDSLEKPINVDPIKILARIQAFENEESFNNLNESSNNQNQQILSLDFFLEIENNFTKKDQRIQDLTESGQQRMFQAENFHHKAIFDAFNDALDHERPYKQKGQPTPWSKQTRVVKPHMTEPQVVRILNKCKEKVLKYSKTGAGTKFAPLPPPPPVTNEFENTQNSQAQQNQQSEEERRNALREERLGDLLTKEVEENDCLWIDYEIEDAQVKFDLADMILEHLASEVATFLMQK